MSAKTYKVCALVLRKTKLREKDLIISLLAEDGSLVQCVAKGARKPGGSFAARLELFSHVDVMLAKGRSLDVVCDARLVATVQSDWTLEKSSCAACLAELLCEVAQPGLQQPKLFLMAQQAFQLMGNSQTSASCCFALCAAALWKVLAQSGFQPSFTHCVQCGCDVPVRDIPSVALAIADGGVVCASCPHPPDSLIQEGPLLAWCNALLRARYREILTWDVPLSVCSAAIDLVRQWARVHTGKNLKSVDFLLTAGLFC